jgi:hypothetical protein
MSAPHPGRRGLGALLIDVIAPIAVYFTLRAMAVPDFYALLAGAGVAAAHAAITLVAERRLRWLPVYVTATFVLTGALAWAVHDPRVLLLKASITAAAIGLYLVLMSMRPAALGETLTPLIARGSDERAGRWRRAWPRRPELRRAMRIAAAVAGLALIAEAAGRAAIVFSFAIAQSLFLAHGPALIAVLVLLGLVRLLVQPAVARAMNDDEARPPRTV